MLLFFRTRFNSHGTLALRLRQENDARRVHTVPVRQHTCLSIDTMNIAIRSLKCARWRSANFKLCTQSSHPKWLLELQKGNTAVFGFADRAHDLLAKIPSAPRPIFISTVAPMPVVLALRREHSSTRCRSNFDTKWLLHAIALTWNRFI